MEQQPTEHGTASDRRPRHLHRGAAPDLPLVFPGPFIDRRAAWSSEIDRAEEALREYTQRQRRQQDLAVPGA